MQKYKHQHRASKVPNDMAEGKCHAVVSGQQAGLGNPRTKHSHVRLKKSSRREYIAMLEVSCKQHPARLLHQKGLMHGGMGCNALQDCAQTKPYHVRARLWACAHTPRVARTHKITQTHTYGCCGQATRAPPHPREGAQDLCQGCGPARGVFHYFVAWRRACLTLVHAVVLLQTWTTWLLDQMVTCQGWSEEFGGAYWGLIKVWGSRPWCEQGLIASFRSRCSGCWHTSWLYQVLHHRDIEMEVWSGVRNNRPPIGACQSKDTPSIF